MAPRERVGQNYFPPEETRLSHQRCLCSGRPTLIPFCHLRTQRFLEKITCTIVRVCCCKYFHCVYNRHSVCQTKKKFYLIDLFKVFLIFLCQGGVRFTAKNVNASVLAGLKRLLVMFPNWLLNRTQIIWLWGAMDVYNTVF